MSPEQAEEKTKREGDPPKVPKGRAESPSYARRHVPRATALEGSGVPKYPCACLLFPYF